MPDLRAFHLQGLFYGSNVEQTVNAGMFARIGDGMGRVGDINLKARLGCHEGGGGIRQLAIDPQRARLAWLIFNLCQCG